MYNPWRSGHWHGLRGDAEQTHPRIPHCLITRNAYKWDHTQTMRNELVRKNRRVGLDFNHVDCYQEVYFLSTAYKAQKWSCAHRLWVYPPS